MYPAFRSERSAWRFSLLLVGLLLLPFLLFWIGLPSREEAYKSIPVKFGVPGHEIQAIYNNPNSPDILFLGSSLTLCAIFPHQLEQSLSREAGHPVQVKVLGMAWQGLDIQYFILRDYLEHHHPDLIVLNSPSPFEAPKSPHLETYRWLRYGEHDGDFSGLPAVVKLQIYAHLVLGGPRDLLSRVRPNVLGSDEMVPDALDNYLQDRRDSGYLGAPFVPENDTPAPSQDAHLLALDSPLFNIVAKPPAYSAHFFEAILDLARQHHCKLILLHIPEDFEYGKSRVPEYAWSQAGAAGYRMIGVPTDALYPGMSRDRFLHYYADHHLNKNGSELFTSAIAPALFEAYEETRATSQSSAHSAQAAAAAKF